LTPTSIFKKSGWFSKLRGKAFCKARKSGNGFGLIVQPFPVLFSQNREGANYMPTVIKCERMTDWDFDHCHDCRRFSVQRGKGLNNWHCALNKETAKGKRDFGMLWAIAYLNNRGYDIEFPEVTIIPAGKRKKRTEEVP
jgi:hypothetical protein